jgi:hypothetical protein
VVVRPYYGAFVRDVLLEAMKYGMVAYAFVRVDLGDGYGRVVVPRVVELEGCETIQYCPYEASLERRVKVTHARYKRGVCTHVFWAPDRVTGAFDSPMARCVHAHTFAWGIRASHLLASRRAADCPIVINNVAATQGHQVSTTQAAVGSVYGYDARLTSNNTLYDMQERAENLARAANRIGTGPPPVPPTRTAPAETKTDASLLILPPATQAVPGISYPVPTTTLEAALEAVVTVVALSFGIPPAVFMRPKYREAGTGDSLDDGVHPLVVSTCETWRRRINDLLRATHAKLLQRIAAAVPAHKLPTSIPTIPPRPPTAATVRELYLAGMLPPRAVADFVSTHYAIPVTPAEIQAMRISVLSSSSPAK